MRSLGVTVFGNALEGGAADIAASDIVVLGVGFFHARLRLACLSLCGTPPPRLRISISEVNITRCC